MDFESLKREVAQFQYTPEQKEEIRIYEGKRKIQFAAIIVFLLSTLGPALLYFFMKFETNSKESTILIFISLPMAILSFAILFYVLKFANKKLRQVLFLPILSDFLPGVSMQKGKFSIDVWKRADDFGFSKDTEIAGENSTDGNQRDDYYEYKNEKFHMKFHHIQTGRWIKTVNDEKKFSRTFEGKVGHFGIKSDMNELFSIHPTSFQKLGERMKKIKQPIRNPLKETQMVISIMRDIVPEERNTYTIPECIKGTEVEQFINDYAKHFKRLLHIVVRQKEIFIFESITENMLEGDNPKFSSPLFPKESKEQEIKSELLMILSYILIVEKIIKLDAANNQ